VNAVPEKDRDTTVQGRAIGPKRDNLLWEAGCVSYPSQPNAVILTENQSRPTEAEYRLERQPPEGSETLRCASAVGPARAPSDRDEGGPTGTTALLCGGGCGGCASRTLHYAAAMVKVPTDGQYSASIPIRGVAA